MRDDESKIILDADSEFTLADFRANYGDDIADTFYAEECPNENEACICETCRSYGE